MMTYQVLKGKNISICVSIYLKRTDFQMEEEKNPILASAIKALQERVHELESANGAYRREIALLRLKLNDNILRQEENHGNNMYDVDNTVQMLSSASETLKELRQIKRENRFLVEESSKLEKQLGKLLRENNEIAAQNSIISNKLKKCQELQSSYETFILQILTPSQIQRNVKLDIIFVNSAMTKITHSMPAKMQMLIKKLRSLPPDFNAQRIETKRKIIQTLLETRDLIDELNYEIEELKQTSLTEGALKRSRPQIETKQNYVAVLIQESNRFNISPYKLNLEL
ncbi:hypothetical protein TRFO_33861 [Tritrichomonas foetus]|uniref:Uncharacterized protein n=1 Tax=Tritrichomonas foetus TaxID=1144522 RepID=A0A1J4JQU8_9EUKA|nr:hypothetical protein TRFO_33861 [Tritrichomonas foetus]|eukprot:OHS99628.1 hypothetical protein TRFO_33861 [Tritrichomonas foetus]